MSTPEYRIYMDDNDPPGDGRDGVKFHSDDRNDETLIDLSHQFRTYWIGKRSMNIATSYINCSENDGS